MPAHRSPYQGDFSLGTPPPSASALRHDHPGEEAVETRSSSLIIRGSEASGSAVHDKLPRVLLVDDDPTTRNLISHFLRREQISVEKASGANEALSLAKTGNPDLMIIDFVVRGMAGIELLSILKAAPETARIPVVVLFPFDEEEAVIKALESGADFIRKPFSPRILVAKIKKILKDAANHAPNHRCL